MARPPQPGARKIWRRPRRSRTRNYLVSTNINADDATLAARVADLEKALKKIDDKAKADKEKAASAMTCTPSGRLQVDTASFTRNGNYLGGANEANGVEFSPALPLP